MKRLLWLLLCGLAFGQNSLTGIPVAVNAKGVPVANAQVAICTSQPNGTAPCGGSTLAQTYQLTSLGALCNLNSGLGPLNGIGCTNPGLADAVGNVVVFAQLGPYWCQYYGPQFSAPVAQPCASVNGSTLSIGNLNNIVFASQQAGSDCGAKINSADALLGVSTPGEIWVDKGCTFTISTPVVLSPYHAVRWVQGGTWIQTALITLAQGDALLGIPSSLQEDVSSLAGESVILQQGIAANLTNMVLIAGQNTEMRDIEIQGNNPTNASTVCVAVDDTNTGNQSRSHLHWDHVTVAQCGGDDVQLFSTTTSNQAAVAEIDYCSFNRSLNGNGMSIRDSTDMHIHFSKFELSSGYGLKAMNSVVWLWDSDTSNNAGGQIYIGVDADSALSISLQGGFNLLGNGITGSSGSAENVTSNVVINGYNGTTCNVLTNGYIFGNTFNNQLSVPGNTNDGIRIIDSGGTKVFDNIFLSGVSGNTFKYAVHVGNVNAGCTAEVPTDSVTNNSYQGPYGTAPYLYAASTDSECNAIGNAPGCIRARVNSCTTAASANATCTTTVTWGVPMADTSYTATCVLDGPSNPAFLVSTSSKLAASVVATIENAPGSALAASGVLNCQAGHD